MILNHSILLFDSWLMSDTIGLSANKDKFGACCNITKLETSWSAWHYAMAEMGCLTRYSVAVF